MPASFQLDNVRIGSGTLFLIAGPCVIEGEEHALFMAEVIKGVTRSLNFPFIFKASYDKANRTSIRSFRGPRIAEGLRDMWNTMVLPTVLFVLARYAPRLIIGRDEAAPSAGDPG